jgi:serine/threonine-protein kinase
MLACPRCGSLYVRDVVFCGLDGERLVEVDRDPLLGATIDRYRISDVLGDGGMARVYRAQHIHLAQPVALKILFGDMASDRTLAERFRREAQSSAQIKHPNVVDVRDFGVSPNGLSFMAMELLEGPTVSEVLKQNRSPAPARIAEIVRQTALGLSAAHKLGFIHRDLKPKNLMIVNDGAEQRVKILDFGLVRPLETTEARLTVQGQVFGTPAYMAPEQIADGAIDARTDLYALGVIIYELLAGRPPFTGPMADVFKKHLSVTPPPLADRSGLGELAHVLMSKAPAARPSSAEEVVKIIDSLGLTIISAQALISKPPVAPPKAPQSNSKPPRSGKSTSPRVSVETPSEPGFDDAALSASGSGALHDTDDSSVDGDIERAAIEAMADRARPTWPRRALLVLLLGGGLFAAYRAYFPRSEGGKPSTPAPAISKTKDKPVRAGTSTETIAILSSRRPPPSKPAPEHSPPAPEQSPAAPEQSPATSPSPTSELELPDLAALIPKFAQLDAQLVTKLADRGLRLEDLRDLEREEVERWVASRQNPDRADAELSLRTQATLFDAAERVHFDAKLLASKALRVRALLDRASPEGRDREWAAEDGKLKGIIERAAGSKTEADRASIARELSLLEAELEAVK